MKKNYFLAMLLMAALLSGTAHATIEGYWRGEASPGRLIDSSGLSHNLTQVGNPGNPSTPAPVPEGSLWLSGNTNTGNSQYTAAAATVPGNNFVVEGWVRANTGGVGQGSLLVSIDDGVSLALSVGIQRNSSNCQIVVQDINTANQVSPFVTSSNVAHLVRVEMAANAGTCNMYVDGVLARTWTRTVANFSTVDVTIGGDTFVGDGTGVYVDAIMLGTSNADVYPGPGIPTATPTTTGTNTSTVTNTPVFTATVTPSPTMTVTPTFTPAALPPTNVRVGVQQPNNTMSILWDAAALPNSWQVLFNGAVKYQVDRSQVAIPTPGTYSYLMQALPQGAAVSATMRSVAPGRPVSADSLPVTFNTPAAPFSYTVPLGITSMDRFTTTGLGQVHAIGAPVQSYTLSVCGEGGSLSSWSVSLQGSLDGVHFTTILTHANGGDAECSGKSSGASFFPYLYTRVSCTGLGLGTATDAQVIAAALP